jgi:hypothetical protein
MMKSDLKRKISKNVLKNEKGQLTLDFIFALTIAFGFTFVFLALSFTLSMVEVAQYATYAASRAYMGAHQTKSLQEQAGAAKFNQVIALPVIASILKAGWFKIGQPTFSNFGQNYPETSSENQNLVFVGAQVPFQAKVLNVQLPLLGSTATQSSTGKATLNSYLMREVTSEENETIFDQQRASQIMQIQGAPYGQAQQATQGQSAPAWIPTDNGC